MGQDWRPNRALSTALILAYLKDIESKIYDSETIHKVNRWVVVGTYSVIAYLVSLHGSEGFLLDLRGLRAHKVTEKSGSKYFLIPLLGK
jgi:hypothetical protein